MMKQSTFTTVAAVVFAFLMMSAPVAASTGASPLALGVDLGSPSAPSGVVEYQTPDGELAPGVFVEVETAEDLDALESWTESSTDRRLVDTYTNTNTALIAIQPTDIKPSLANWRTYLPGNKGTATELGYVTGWSWDRKVSLADPIQQLDAEDDYQEPSGALVAESLSGGEWTPKDAAWKGDAPNVDLNRTTELVGADSVAATGAGVDIAVIDSGVNTGNGTLYGDGTEGSAFRITDAHDFVQNESVNLSVSRENMTTELAKVGDPNGHGSWVSSAVLNARSGIAPGANLMAYRALNKNGEGSTADIRAAIARANREGADIIVMSLGSPVYSDAMAAELSYALGEDGNVTGAFIAVGNSYQTTRYVSSPADVEDAIGVAATNAVDAEDAKRAYFSNVGPDTGLDGSDLATRGVQPTLAAPGMNIKAPVWTSPYADGGRESTSRLSGTSMATPIAAGVGALLLDADPGLVGQPTEFRERLVDSGAHTPHIGLTEARGGLVNAHRAINGYSGEDAPDRERTSQTEGRDDANRWLAGDVGVKIAAISDTTGAYL